MDAAAVFVDDVDLASLLLLLEVPMMLFVTRGAELEGARSVVVRVTTDAGQGARGSAGMMAGAF